MRYLLVDRILDVKPGESVRGIKNVAMSEDFLEFHFPKNPIMPGVLLLEALTQLAGWLEAATSDFDRWFLPTRVSRCAFYGFVLPGDQVELQVESAPNPDSSLKKFKGVGLVEGKRKIKADFEGESITLAAIEDVEDYRKFFKVLSREQRF